MINKTIHYCWFGSNPKPKIVQKCIKSWRKFCPDFEIIEWNENNFDINICQYVKEAYDNKKWAFVSDYARFYVLNRFGGVYVDTDVELIKPIDNFLQNNFTAFESCSAVATGLIMACNADNVLCKSMLEEYESDIFIVDGDLNLKTVCERVTDILVRNGLKLEDKTQDVLDFKIYDTSYFNPYNMNTGKIELKPNTISIHHYAGTWVSKKDKFRGNIYKFIYRFGGKKIAKLARKIFGRKK